MSGEIVPAVDQAAVTRISVPTLLLAGEKIKGGGALRLVTEELGRLRPEARRKLAVIPGAGQVMWMYAAFSHPQSSASRSPAEEIGQVSLLLLGWGLAQYPYLIYPDVTLRSAAPEPTLLFVLIATPIGMALLAPSPWLLFRVFKRSIL